VSLSVALIAVAGFRFFLRLRSAIRRERSSDLVQLLELSAGCALREELPAAFFTDVRFCEPRFAFFADFFAFFAMRRTASNHAQPVERQEYAAGLNLPVAQGATYPTAQRCMTIHV